MKTPRILLNSLLVLAMLCASLFSIPAPPPVQAASSQQAALPAAPDATIVTPGRQTLTLSPGQSTTFKVTVTTDEDPIEKGDVMFVFDLTGSMGSELAQTKISATDIMSNIVTALPKTWFGVASFMDYNGFFSYPGYAQSYGSGPDYPWHLDQEPTGEVPDVAGAINALALANGDDGPESYTRVLYELPQVNWRSGAKKIAVLFGDAPPHDLDFNGYNTGGDPGPDYLAQTADDLDFETTVRALAEAGVTVLAVNSGSDSGLEGATFRAMSVGYGDLAGTKGQYFLLSQASTIPQVATQLIMSETTSIDTLQLEVTDQFASWVQVSPPVRTDVSANTTVDFDVTITAPPGIGPGFYPFLIRTVGDGNILGLTYVDVTVPGADDRTASGFVPSKDGFSFVNDSSVTRTLDWDMFRQFFGSANVEYDNDNRIGAANAFFEQHYAPVGEGGMCSGFSVLAGGNFRGMQPLAGPYTMRSFAELAKQPKLAELLTPIAYSQGIQMGREVSAHKTELCDTLGKSPSAHFRYIKDKIGRDVPVVLSISWNITYTTPYGPMGPGAHALVPYKYELPSSDLAYLYVYDPNRPKDDNRRIEFDLKNDKWSYKWAVPLWPDVTITGDSSACTLKATPQELFRHQGVPWWGERDAGLGGAGAAAVSDEQAALRLFSTSGPVQLLLTDDEGRRLGFDGGVYYEEIPGGGFQPLVQQAGLNLRDGMYFVPAATPITAKMQSVAYGDSSISVIEAGVSMMLDWIEVNSGGVLEMSFPAKNAMLLRSIAEEWPGSLTIDRLLAAEDRQAVVKDIFLQPGESIMFALQDAAGGSGADRVQFTTDAAAAEQMKLALARAGGDGYRNLGAGSLDIPAGAATTVSVPNWSELSGLVAEVDTDQDGYIDRQVPLVNQSQPALLVFDPMNTNLVAGAVYTLTVGVRDQFGTYVQDGTPVDFVTDMGVLSSAQVQTSGGLASVQYMSESTGTANLQASVGSIARVQVLNVGAAAQFVSAPVTSAVVNQPYTYQVQVSGVPTPTLRLAVQPEGMTLDSQSGLIQWTPPAVGSYAVTVVADNGVGAPAEQSFTILVSEPPDPMPQKLYLPAVAK